MFYVNTIPIYVLVSHSILDSYMQKHPLLFCRPEDDIRHWSKFPSFTPLLSQIETDGGKSLDLSNYPHIFMVCHYLTLYLFMYNHFIYHFLDSACRDGRSNTLSMLELTVG
jgi:hypothetical protein